MHTHLMPVIELYGKANEKICMNVIWEYIKDHILLLSEDKYFLIASLKETLNKARSLL